jgi:hypothetical protein
MSERPAIKRRSQRTRRSRRTDEFQQIRYENEKKLRGFLAKEQTAEKQEVFFDAIITRTKFIDGVVQAFYDHIVLEGFGKRLSKIDFDPKVEWDAFIKTYTKKKFPVKNAARKGIGGRNAKELTRTVQNLLDEAESAGVEEAFDSLKEKTWSRMKPGKGIETMKRARTFGKDFRERVGRLAPHLLPKNPARSKGK